MTSSPPPLLSCESPHSSTAANVHSRTPFQRLSTIEVQLIMHSMDLGHRLRLARCSRQLYADASQSYAWKYTNNYRVSVDTKFIATMKDSAHAIHQSLLRYLPGGFRLQAPIPRESDRQSWHPFLAELLEMPIKELELKQIGKARMDSKWIKTGLNRLNLHEQVHSFKCNLNRDAPIVVFPLNALIPFKHLTTIHLIRVQLPHHFQTALLRIPELYTLILDSVSFQHDIGGWWFDVGPLRRLHSCGTPVPLTKPGQSELRCTSKLHHLSVLNTDMLGDPYEFFWLHFLPFELEELIISNSTQIGFSNRMDRYPAAFRLPIALKRLHLLDLKYVYDIYPYLPQLPALEQLFIRITFNVLTKLPLLPTLQMILAILVAKSELMIEMIILTHPSMRIELELFLGDMNQAYQRFPERFTIRTESIDRYRSSSE